MSSGILSLSGKSRILPDSDVVSEVDTVSSYAENLGFSDFEKQAMNAKISPSLSDAISRL